MDILEELKARDERIERLEKVLLFLMCSNPNPNYLQEPPERILRGVSGSGTSQSVIKKLIGEYGSVEKVIEEFLAICEDRLSSL